MRLLLFTVALVLASTAASAQTCHIYGSFMSCSDGTTGYRYGNAQLFGSANQPRRNPTPMYGSWDSLYSGTSIIFSDGDRPTRPAIRQSRSTPGRVTGTAIP